MRSLNGNQSPESKCYCVVSDNLIHNTEAVFSYVSKIIPILKEEYPQIKKSIISLMVQAASIKIGKLIFIPQYSKNLDYQLPILTKPFSALEIMFFKFETKLIITS